MAGDWRISANERAKYDVYFQQCGPIQGYLSGEQAREFFIQSNLSGDILRKIWDLADITADGRLDKREFAIACHLIASQVQMKGTLPATLPPELLSDSDIISTNGIVTMTKTPASMNVLNQPLISNQMSSPITPAIRSKYLQQFHALVDVTKTNGYMPGAQAKIILQQTGLSNVLLHQIWNLADYDKDGRLTTNEFVVAMHCCDIARTGQTLPNRLPDEWLPTNIGVNEPLIKSSDQKTFASLNRQLQETIIQSNANEQPLEETTENERKAAMQTYEEKRLKNYEDGNRELERRRQLLREQEEREQREREERERKRELELQKQKEEQERKKQIEIERQLEKQRQIEQQKEEERKKLFEQREAARKEMERKSRLEWERQRMQELSTQKCRLQEQINDLKSREKAFGLELESMNDTMQTCQTKINQTETNIHTIDQSIADIERNILSEKNLFENVEQQKKDFTIQLNRIQAERESLDSSLDQLKQSKEFYMGGNKEADYIKNLQIQIENFKHQTSQIDEEIKMISEQCKENENQMEHLTGQLDQIENEAKDKSVEINNDFAAFNPVTLSTNAPANFANFDQFNSTNSLDDQAYFPSTTPSTTPVVDIDPFQTVDPFASQSNMGTAATNNDWFQPTNVPKVPMTTTSIIETVALVPSTKTKKPAPRATQNPKDSSKPLSMTADPWGETTAHLNNNNNGNNWAQFDKSTEISNYTEYRALYDYTPERPDELALLADDIIKVDPTKQQDEHWLFGRIGNDKEGYFPVAYTEPIASTSSVNVPDKTSRLSSGSWVVTLADCQGKTNDKHLSFQKNELILVREQKDATWYSGKLHGKVGWFPRNYVRPATEVEIENRKNSTKNTPTSEKALPLSSSNGSLSHHAHNDIYEAIYAFEATDPSDLSFEVGEHILVLKRDGDWWTGQIGDRTGTFPYNYVQQLDQTHETVIAIQSFQGTEDNHLSFEQGQLIYITNKDDKDWYKGEIRLPDQTIRVGSFPANCVEIQTNLPRCIAIFPYDAQQDDELSFPADAVLEILEQAHTSGWFKGRFDGKVGLVPSTYVQLIDTSHQSSSTTYHLPPNIMLSTPSTINSSQPRLSDDSGVDDAVTLTTDGSNQQLSNNTSRVAAIRELIETEQRYVNDLRTVANEFIKPLSNGRVLNDYEIEQLFSNWFSLIACNSIFLSTLQDKVQYKEHTDITEPDVVIQISRSVSMSNIVNVTNVKTNETNRLIVHNRPHSFTPAQYHSVSLATSSNDLVLGNRIKNERLDDNIVPQCSYSASSSLLTINDSTRIGDILCSYLPYMADSYFQYCNHRAQANKYLQTKVDLNTQFRADLDTFQNKTGGLSLNGYLTKPIQRFTRYPLLIDKILKHTPNDHPDYPSIQQAYECARELNERINKQIREQENSLRLDWLQQHFVFGTDEDSIDGYVFDELFKFNSTTKYHKQRQLLLHGYLIKVPSGKELLSFLFNDFILFSTIKTSWNNLQTKLFEPKSNVQLKLYRLPLFLTDITAVKDIADDQFTFSISAKTFQKPLLLKTQQTNVRTLWTRAINNALEECQKIHESNIIERTSFTNIDDENTTKSPIARLMILVQEAQNLHPSTTDPKRHRTINPYCEVTVSTTTLQTTSVKGTNNPKWNAQMTFYIYDLKHDTIHINIFDSELFSPDENIGYTTLQLNDLLPCSLHQFLDEPTQSFTRNIYLNTGASLLLECTFELLS